MKELHAAVIGAGYLGSLHAEKYAACDGVKLIGVADVVAARANRIAARHGCRATQDFRELLPAADLVSVAVPSEAHYAVVRDCLAAGVHVLVEKPIARTLEEADSLVAQAASRRICLAVDHLERFNPAFAELRALLARPLFVEAERLAGFQGRGADVDVVLDLMVHDIDLVLAMVPNDIVSVSGCGFKVLTDSVDIANARIEFAGGQVANLSASRVSQAPVRKLRAFGHDLYVSADLHSARLRIVRRPAGAAVVEEECTFPGVDMLGASIRSFIEAVREGRAPDVSGADGRRALALALKIRRMIDARLASMSSAVGGEPM